MNYLTFFISTSNETEASSSHNFLPKNYEKLKTIMNSISCLAQLITLLFLLSNTTAAETTEAPPAQTLPSCQASCGNVSIPFPFGIGKNCYKNQLYEIVCNRTSNNVDSPFLKSIQREVVGIDIGLKFQQGSMRIKSPIISSGCLAAGVLSPVVNMTGTPFFFSLSNRFVVAGCNNRGLMTNIDPQIVGCESSCDENTRIIKRSDYRSCDGDKCCETTIPTDLQVFGASIENSNSSTNISNGCRTVFVTSETLSQASMSDPRILVAKQLVEVDLDWYLDSELDSRASNQFSCSNMISSFFNFSYCYCGDGYEGNPYLDNGCIDINECEVGARGNYGCTDGSTCVNYPGHYKCEVKTGSIIGVVLLLGFGLLILILMIWGLYKLIKKRKKRNLKKKFFKRNGGLLLQQQLSSNEGNADQTQTKIFSSKELDTATDKYNVNRILGQGGQGTVYKGMLVDGRIVAVKKSKKMNEGQLVEFVNEVRVLSQINHRNVVTLMGCCMETEVPMLVYEFIPNGTLYQYLHDQNEDFPMTWETRLRIAIEVAGALSYLHSSAMIPIYHRDIKSLNILLDGKYRAKIADFGSSRTVTVDQTHLTTMVQGTFGYLDPEYFQSSQFTDKSDVYSFGVVLVELLTGEKPISFVNTEEGRVLATHFIHKTKENRLSDILDARIKADSETHESQIKDVANLARRCLYLNGKRRPTMKEVAMELERIRSPQTNYHVDDAQEESDDNIARSWDVISAPSETFTTTSTFGGEPSVLNNTM